jgi:predicted acylesterase/phospholipase RssA
MLTAESLEQELTDPAAYRSASLDCDVVMKGGITSGVTYPWAVCEIARTYRLRSVGGSSAGAIAAAAAAAAEVGRNSETGGFTRLAELPRLLGETAEGTDRARLLSLFQPSDGTQPYFDLLIASLEAKGFRKVLALVGALLRSFRGRAVLGSLPGVGIAGLAIGAMIVDAGGALSWIALVLAAITGIVLALVGQVIAAGVAAVFGALRALPRNLFGVCTGYADPADGDPPPLTTWLADEFDRMAGRQDSPAGTTGEPGAAATPVARPAAAGSATAASAEHTQGDHEDLSPTPYAAVSAENPFAAPGEASASGAPTERPDRPLVIGDLTAAGVRLQMLTTNLTDGTPYTLPFRSRQYFYKPEEFRQLFPERVVDWMVERAPTPRDTVRGEAELFARMETEGALPLPVEEDFPVIVAVRMSLSFPILLSAIPLWFADWTDAVHPGVIRCAWFSDGGITSNFPIHFFDRPLPRWPTFGINLGPFPPGREPDLDQAENVWSPMDNAGGILPRWSGIDGVPGFFRALVDTLQNWGDNAQVRVPGYRDRIALIRHTEEEGGMNLNMPADRIDAFSLRGAFAGRLLVDRFSRPPASTEQHLSWDNHRWVRYRSLMALLEDLLEKFRTGYQAPPEAEAMPYPDLIARHSDVPPTSYPMTATQKTFARLATEEIIRLVESWDQSGETFRDQRVPRPTPQLRVTPTF